MRIRHTSRIGPLLLSLGLLVGGLAGLGLMVGFEPARLPAELLNIAAYKLTFMAAGGLLVAGGLLIRYSRRRGRNSEPESLASPSRPELSQGPAPMFEQVRDRDRVPSEKPHPGD
jgi:hypothetical protein